jgi:hypothetical protein
MVQSEKRLHSQAQFLWILISTITAFAVAPPVWGQAPGTIVTISRSDILGDGGPAVRAVLNHPYDVARDPFGNLYISGDQIRKIIPDGRIFTAVDTPAAYLTTDSQGNVFFLNATQKIRGQSLKRLDLQGNVTTIAEVNGTGLAVDDAGNSYVTDATANRLYKIAPDGVKTILAGGGYALGDNGPATQARLRSPDAVALDSKGSVYFVDRGNNRIRKVDANGIITTVVSDSQLISPYYDHRLGFDLSGHLYYSTGNSNIITLYRVEQGSFLPIKPHIFVGGFFFQKANVMTYVDYGGKSVHRMTLELDGTVTGFTNLAGYSINDLGEGVLAKYVLIPPYELAIDPSNNIVFWQGYVDSYGIFLRKISPDGILSTLHYSGNDYSNSVRSFLKPNRNGDLFIRNSTLHQPATQILRYSLDGKVTSAVGGGDFTEDTPAPANVVQIAPVDAAPDAQGRLFFLSSAPKGLKMLDTDGFVYTLGGQGNSLADNLPTTQAQLVNPTSVTVDTQGNLYLTDDRLVRKIGTDGTIRTIAGGGSERGDEGDALHAQLNEPKSIEVDSVGTVFFAEGGRIRKVTSDGRILNVAGTAGPGGYTGEGGPATQATLPTIYDFAIDQDGNLIVSIPNRLLKVVKVAAPGLVGGIPFRGSGDVNGDRAVNVLDVVLTLRSLVGLATLTEEQSSAADLNRDGKVKVDDVNALLRRTFGLD